MKNTVKMTFIINDFLIHIVINFSNYLNSSINLGYKWAPTVVDHNSYT